MIKMLIEIKKQAEQLTFFIQILFLELKDLNHEDEQFQ